MWETVPVPRLNIPSFKVSRRCFSRTIKEALFFFLHPSCRWLTGNDAFQTTDGPNGARGAAFHSGTRAACFPASVSLAAGFDEEVAEEIGRAIAQEAKSKGAYVL